MSHDLGVWADPLRRHAADPAGRYEALSRLQDNDPPSDTVAQFLTDLAERWPGETDDAFESSPWATWPLDSQATQSGVVLKLRYDDQLEKVLTEIVRRALAANLVVFDPQGDTVYTAADLRPTPSMTRLRRTANAALRMRPVRMVLVLAAIALGLILADLLTS